ncbi:PREDICTED: uncharacterized protein LOC105447785 [Wasmannia auropunctata]|uniref:uncharacterized protein LOC105447785 n=1 Tax=Wasmannia auropunctata TaxID=64793 RepID=UPI0005EF4718|nr:PREDICTED: uncharacterized protein LOC105447785 [Wasmannia auropunctata]
MERKFKAEPKFRELYAEFMREYETLHHMSKVPREYERSQGQTCYLPHHGVFKTCGNVSKIRVVFNGSARGSASVSLNDKLLAGPNLLPMLADVLARWRIHRFAVVTDIAKMYRQILVHPDDRDLQRILWRDNRNEIIQEYRLNTVTYGLSCAPYLAIRTLQQLAEDEESRFPAGAMALRRDVYVDDILTGADTKTEALNLQDQLIQLCSAGGFPLRKWAANSDDLLSRVPADYQQLHGLREWEPNEGHSTLGVQWQPRDDVFAFRVRPHNDGDITKRVVLSETARLFDGMRVDWDQPLRAEDARAWHLLRKELPLLENVRVPRWLHTGDGNARVEIHGFADASERAFAAVTYLRVINEDGGCHVSLLQAKTRVAPLRQVSVPRLELCAAALLVKLVEHVREVLGLSMARIHFWSDSTVTLAWIRGHPTRWTTYVANRVAEIQRALPDAMWHHLPGEENPADCASRGLSPHELLQHALWWQGPAWLGATEAHFTEARDKTEEEPEMPEQRASVHAATEVLEEDPVLLRFGTLHRLLRVTAWCLRWTRTLRPRESVLETLTSQDLREAERRWIKAVQSTWFSAELRDLGRGRAVSRRSGLLPLNPFLDENGILRVGGRLRHAILSEDEKHPVILPRNSWLTVLMVDSFHRRALHGGVQLTLGMIRQRFWIPGGRAMVKRRIHRCMPCVRWRAASPHPLMGDLPRPRVRAARPFTHTGVDYAGPVLLRTAKGRGQKAYKGFLVIFVCLATRAVHLEVASDYTAEGFLAAYRRFVSRRGLCATMHSDQGTNFIGADAQLKRLLQQALQDRSIADALASDGVHWRFNPPAAPHFGGVWEAAVKSTKHHLRRVMGEATLTYEELSTFLTQIEACLNSRPLAALSDDPEDLTALTPGHFLVGTALRAVPEPSLTEEPIGRLTRWQLLQQMRDHFWQRWSREYLQSLNTRPKWRTKDVNPCVGDLCLVRGEQTPPTRWPLGRVTATHHGDDGQVRVVTVRTATTTLTRPTQKIILLRLDDARDS